MNDLRKAAEMALEVLRHSLGHSNEAQEKIDKTKQALRQALAQPEQEPVAWFIQYEYRHEFLWRKPNELEQKTALEIKPLYTAPPKREWVGLTDEDRSKLLTKHHGWNEFGKAIKAKLKDKNN